MEEEILWKYGGNKPSELGEKTDSILITIKITRWKYNRSKPSALGEIVNPATISTYFTERSGVYFYCISIVFPFIISQSEAECISTLFPPYFACLPEAGISHFSTTRYTPPFVLLITYRPFAASRPNFRSTRSFPTST